MTKCINQLFRPAYVPPMVRPEGRGDCSICTPGPENKDCSCYTPVGSMTVGGHYWEQPKREGE